VAPLLPWIEYCYNTSFQSSLRTSPFRVVYGRDPPTVRSYSLGEARLPAVDAQLQDRDEFLAEVREWLEQAQQQHKAFYNRKHRQLDFVVGEWAWLRLLHSPIVSLDVKGRGKLGPKFFRPFQVTEKIGDVAYKLQLSAGARLHDVFHVGLLKKFHGEAPSTPGTLPLIRHSRACPTPATVLRRRLAQGQSELLVQWIGLAAADASWVPKDDFPKLCSNFKLEDELVQQEGRDVMVGLQYHRRNNAAGNKGATPA
jgi:hypothetical protein